MITPRYLNEKEVQLLTGIKVATLRNQRSLGMGMPYSKIGSMVRYNLDDVVEYMDSHRVSMAA